MPNDWLKKYATETSKRKPNVAKNKAVRQTGRRGGAGAKVSASRQDTQRGLVMSRVRKRIYKCR